MPGLYFQTGLRFQPALATEIGLRLRNGHKHPDESRPTVSSQSQCLPCSLMLVIEKNGIEKALSPVF